MPRTGGARIVLTRGLRHPPTRSPQFRELSDLRKLPQSGHFPPVPLCAFGTDSHDRMDRTRRSLRRKTVATSLTGALRAGFSEFRLMTVGADRLWTKFL
jgi:hypothetical protein